MISRRDRVIATLIVWATMLMTLALFIQQFQSPGLNLWGNWYSYQSITAADPLVAGRALDALSGFSTGNFQAVQMFVVEQMNAYAPLLALLVLALIGAAVFSTYVIWRSVIVPDIAHELAEKRKTAASLEQAERGIRHADAEQSAISDEAEPAAIRKARS